MPKPESKGQRVKSFTMIIPLGAELLDAEKTTVPIYFQAKESKFAAYLPEHIHKAIEKHPEAPKELWQGTVRSALADDIEPAFTAACKLFRRIQQNAVRKKVLLIDVEANHPKSNRYTVGMERGDGVPAFKDISFCASPALAITYQVMWQVGDGLYRMDRREDDEREPHMTYISKAPDPNQSRGAKSRFLIDWTEEREQFVESIRGGLVILIERLWQLLNGDTAQNVDRLIAGGGGLMLPAPKAD